MRKRRSKTEKRRERLEAAACRLGWCSAWIPAPLRWLGWPRQAPLLLLAAGSVLWHRRSTSRLTAPELTAPALFLSLSSVRQNVTALSPTLPTLLLQALQKKHRRCHSICAASNTFHLLPSLPSAGLPRLVHLLRDESHLNIALLTHLVNASTAPALVPPAALPLPLAPVQSRSADAAVDGELKIARSFSSSSCSSNLLRSETVPRPPAQRLSAQEEVHLQVLPQRVHKELQRDDPRENSHRRAAVPLFRVWKELQKARPPERPHVHPHQGETPQMWQVWNRFQPVAISGGAQNPAHREPRSKVPAVQTLLRSEEQLEESPSHPHRGEAEAAARSRREFARTSSVWGQDGPAALS